jgi:hypothetical protein
MDKDEMIHDIVEEEYFLSCDNYLQDLMKEYENLHTEELYMIREDDKGLYYTALDFDESGMVRIDVEERFRRLIDLVK